MQTWSEAFSNVWGNFIGTLNDSSSRLWRFLFCLVLIGGSIYAGWSYKNMLALREEKTFTPISTPANIAGDRQRLDAMFKEVQEAANHRSNSLMTVRIMRDLGRYAFNLFVPPKIESELKISEFNPELDIPAPEPLPEFPPEITVKAIMIVEDTHRAVINIEGVGQAFIVKAGDTFLGKKMRIVRVDKDQVVIRWNGNEMSITPEIQY